MLIIFSLQLRVAFSVAWRQRAAVRCLKSSGSYDVTIVYGQCSDNSVLLQEAGVYLRPGV